MKAYAVINYLCKTNVEKLLYITKYFTLSGYKI